MSSDFCNASTGSPNIYNSGVQRVDLGSADRERIKMCSRELLAGVLAPIAQLDRWSEKEQTQAEVETSS